MDAEQDDQRFNFKFFHNLQRISHWTSNRAVTFGKLRFEKDNRDFQAVPTRRGQAQIRTRLCVVGQRSVLGQQPTFCKP